MLSAFTARPIIELRQRDKTKIESILTYRDRVLVGLNTGALRIYRLNEPPAAAPNPPSADSSLAHSQTATSQNTTSQTTPSEPPSESPPSHATTTPQDPTAAKPTDLLREIERFSPRA